MITLRVFVELAVLVALLSPAALFVLLGLPSLLSRPLSEPVVGRATRLTMLVAFVASGAAFVALLASGAEPWISAVGVWFGSGAHGFRVDVLIDPLALGFVALATAVSGVDAAFSHRYLHREPGYNRYFVLFALFVTGITLIGLAGSVEVLFAGWELLGLSSALLVGFFQARRAPVANALRVFAVYRVSDAAMLAAAVLVHHWVGSGALTLIFSGASGATAGLDGGRTTIIALLLLLAVVGKSGLLPLSGWLPRAMEGPTSSSAVFYGSLSIHAGCFLLLRAEPLLAQAPLARGLAVALGLATAAHATLSARVQTDVKSALTYAALTQVGLIVAEIGLGLTTVAFIHMLGHACYRLLQFLSAPNILHERHQLENALGGHLELGRAPAGAGGTIRRWLYLVALERGFADALIDRFVVAPFVALARALDRFDRLLCGREARDDD